MKIAEQVGNIALEDPFRSEHSLLRSGCPAVLVACILLATGVVHAQVLDSVDVLAKGSGAEIVVRFATQVQYVRHSPRDAGATLRVYLQLTAGAGTRPGDLRPATMRPPKNDLVPPFTVTYPASGDALLIVFERPTRFNVHPGADGRSLRIVVSPSSGG